MVLEHDMESKSIKVYSDIWQELNRDRTKHNFQTKLAHFCNLRNPVTASNFDQIRAKAPHFEVSSI